ncbi:MAG: hypothetical protein QY327_06505 [Fimbriimonadaceae bacterium]|nr:MAG: hypothetical protein UZ18_ATM001000364 [Armatimonadetes bacterium OLB18]RIK00299.1 MAG: hypothetical protein DCC46_05960 [Armatimonadota bacterium]WKZ81547.1 MAG: hypothetical protein QY327_06505 [Fimbriimonadaceae bacterium]
MRIGLGLELAARGAGVTPPAIPGLALWLDATSSGLYLDAGLTLPVSSDNDPVGGWKDLSGGGFHVVQATATKRPLWKESALNGLPAVRFDGTDDHLTGDPLAALFSGSDVPWSFFCVWQPLSLGSTTHTLACLASGSSSTQIETFVRVDTASKYNVRRVDNSGVAKNPIASASTSAVVQRTSAIMTGTTVEAFRDGAMVGGIGPAADYDVGSLTLDRFAVGIRRTTFDSNPLHGDVGELILYGRALSSGERAQVEAYLQRKWGV